MPATLRCEIFPADLDASVAFYVDVLEVDDLERDRERVAATGWPVSEEITERLWGLRDFRLLDPDGYYWRITTPA